MFTHHSLLSNKHVDGYSGAVSGVLCCAVLCLQPGDASPLDAGDLHYTGRTYGVSFLLFALACCAHPHRSSAASHLMLQP